MPITIPHTQSEIVDVIHNSYSHKPKLLKMDEALWKYAVRSVIRGENLLIQGDSGFGKTYLATTLAEVFDRPLFRFNLGATQDARSYLVGNTFFDPTRGTYVEESYFVKAIKTPFAIVLLDEVSRAHPDAHNILMTVLDKTQRYLRLDEHPDTPTIDVADGVTFIGTANVGTEYTATRTIDRAFLDRWSILIMPHLTGEQELELLTDLFPDLPVEDRVAISEIAVSTRDEVKKDSPKIDTVISTRATVELASLMNDGFNLREAAEVKIFPFYSPIGGSESPQTYMRQLVQQYVKNEKNKDKKTPFNANDPNNGRIAPW
jgi:MoxR-like ATPase